MRAAYIKNHGDLDQIHVGNLESPILNSDEVLVAPINVALNHLDLFVIKGWSGLQLQMPHILGCDGAGIVKEVGNRVTTVQVGDKVTINPGVSCGKCNFCLAGKQNLCSNFGIIGESPRMMGTFAEYFKIPEVNTFIIPETLPIDQAAAAPLTFLTAWRMLTTQSNLQPGQTVVVQGASGGVATAAIQIAKLLGAKVIATTSSPEKVKKTYSIGADFVFNYQINPEYGKIIYKEFTEKQGVDLVVDSVGSATFQTSLKLLRPGGKLVTCGATTGPKTEIDIRSIFWKQLKIIGSTMSNQSEFFQVMSLIADGKLKPVIDSVYPFESIKEAELKLQESNQFGKILLKIGA